MHLSKQTHHAIDILIHCARAKEALVTTPDIARLEGITEHNVAKIVHLLVRNGFVTTVRGRAGGLRLSRPAAKIKLGDVVRATEAHRVQKTSPRAAAGIPAKYHDAHVVRLVDQAREGFIGVLDRHTVADLSAAPARARKAAAKTRSAATPRRRRAAG
ncbi:MAG: Rrf2 family transcriptional regulator [Pseudomonadota bacterium]